MWLASLRRVVFPLLTFGLGAAAKLYPSFTVRDYEAAAALIFLLLLLEEFFSNIRPARRLADIAPIAMDNIATLILATLEQQSISARMCVLKAARTPSTLWFQKYFRMKWNINMDDDPDVNISFPVTAGVSGECYKQRSPRVANAVQIENFPLPPACQKMLGDRKLAAIASIPIFEAKKKGRQSGKIIGVLNLDSFDSAAYSAFQEQTVIKNMKRLAGLASHIYG